MHFDPTWLQVFTSATTALASIPLILEALRNRKNKDTQENPGKHWDDKTDSPGDSKDGNPQDGEGTSEEATDTPEDSKEQAPESTPGEESESGESDGETDLDEATGSTGETDSSEEADWSDDAGQDTEEAQESAEGAESSSSDGEGTGNSAGSTIDDEGTDGGTDSNADSASQEADSDAEATEPGSEAVDSAGSAQGGSGGTQGDLEGTGAELEEVADAQSLDTQEANTDALDGELVRQGETREPPVSEPVYDTALTLAALAVAEEARQEEKERNARGAVEEGNHITAYVPVVTAESQPGTGAGSNQGRWNPPGLRFYNSEWMQKIERILTHKMGIVKETKPVTTPAQLPQAHPPVRATRTPVRALQAPQVVALRLRRIVRVVPVTATHLVAVPVLTLALPTSPAPALLATQVPALAQNRAVVAVLALAAPSQVVAHPPEALRVVSEVAPSLAAVPPADNPINASPPAVLKSL